MELERVLFMAYDREINNFSQLRRGWRVCSILLKVLVVCLFCMLVLGHHSMTRSNGCIERAFSRYLEINQDRLYPDPADAKLMNNFSISPFYEPNSSDFIPPASLQNRTQFYTKGDLVNFYILKNPIKDNSDYPFVRLNNSWPSINNAILISATEILDVYYLAKKDFSWPVVHHVVPVDNSCFSEYLGFRLAFIEGNWNFAHRGILQYFSSMVSNGIWIISQINRQAVMYHHWPQDRLESLAGTFSYPFQAKIYLVLYITLGLLFSSFAAALFFKSISIAVPLFILIIVKCCKCDCFAQNWPRFELVADQIHHSHPWIGIYLNTLVKSRNGKFFALSALGITISTAFFYFYFQVVVHFCIGMLIPRSVGGGLTRDTFFYLLYFEIWAIAVFRTRESLYFGPKLLYLSFLAYILYLNLTPTPMSGTAFLMHLFFSLDTFCSCLLLFEIKALDLPANDRNKPTPSRPRLLYQPLFSLVWYHDSPPFWSYFMPLFDRTYFSEAELSVVDRNFMVLQRHLNDRRIIPGA